ncbi:uncharacterized protein LOC143258751 [Megalopta genalis]|uniref:uncharacterized protein LOC143258751 n=2 Tax=Megalopta genalis TaxID=115081 RepID=UPI003FD281B8
MSDSLVNKGLELLGYERTLNQEKKKQNHTKYQDTLDLISSKHKIISRNNKIDLATIFKRSRKVSIYETKKKLASEKDLTDKNVERLLMLSKNRINTNVTVKLLDRAVKKKCIPKKEEPKEPETTEFTEEDFMKFEQEYVDH